MTVKELIDKLKAMENQEAEIFVWDPYDEISGEIETVKDIIEPSENKEYYIVATFG